MNERFPLGALVTRERLDSNLHAMCSELRATEPVTWVPEFNGWLVSKRDLVVEVLEDAERFTVDDPRFAVRQVTGSNMLTLDGTEQRMQRQPFEPDFKMSAVRRNLIEPVTKAAEELVATMAAAGSAEVRTELGAPLAVAVVGDVLGLDVDLAELLSWYDEMVVAMAAVSNGSVDPDARPAVMDQIGDAVRASSTGRGEMLSRVATELPLDDVVSNTSIVLFGGIETSETMTASAFAHLLTLANAAEIVAAPDLLMRAIDESLRLEPAVAQIDRFATVDTELAGVEIAKGDFVICSVAGANRDPDFYDDPGVFNPHRLNARNHVAFAKGPHICLGMHLARVETRIAIETAFANLPGLSLDNEVEWWGSVFRKPKAVNVSWTTP